MRNGGISEVIRYEEELKQKVQSIDNSILQGGRSESDRKELDELIQEEEILLKYLEVESSKMAGEVRAIYAKNVSDPPRSWPASGRRSGSTRSTSVPTSGCSPGSRTPSTSEAHFK